MLKFLSTINRACYEYNFRRTLPFSEERENVVNKYVKRKNFLSKLDNKLNILKKKG